MTTARAIPQEPMSVRSKRWLDTQPSLEQVKKAYVAIISKVRTAMTEDLQETIDALAEFYVERGGDLCNLPSLDVEPALQLVSTQTEPVQLDSSPLCPDTPPARPLSQQEKKAIVKNLRSILTGK